MSEPIIDDDWESPGSANFQSELQPFVQKAENLSDAIRATWIEEWKKHKVRSEGKNVNYAPGPRWDGGQDSMGRTYKSIWPRVAAALLTHGADYTAVIQGVFARAGLNSPTPSELLRTDRYDDFTKRAVNLEEGLAKGLKRQHLTMATQFRFRLSLYNSVEQTLVAILYDRSLDLSALYRHCFAKRNDLPDVAFDWFEFAVAQYQRACNAYDKAWGSFLTEDVRSAAEIADACANTIKKS